MTNQSLIPPIDALIHIDYWANLTADEIVELYGLPKKATHKDILRSRLWGLVCAILDADPQLKG